MSKIYMIRHGQASFGKDNYDQLSQCGILQAKILAEYFYATGTTFDVIYTGTLARHNQTLHEYLSLLKSRNLNPPEIINLEAFNEYNSEGILKALIPLLIQETPSFGEDVKAMFRDNRSFTKVFEKVMLRWVNDAGGLPDDLKWQSFYLGVNKGLEDVMKNHGRNKNIAVFTSGGPIAAAVKKGLHLSDQDTIRLTWQIINSSVSGFKCTNSRFMVSFFNNYAHLELKSDNNLITYR